MTPAQSTTAFSLARDSLQANESSARLGRFRRRGYQRYRLVSSQIDLSMVWKRRWFIISMLLGCALMSAPTPSGKRIAWWIVRMTGTNVYWISFGITVVCGVLAAFIGEHTVAAMMLPVGVTLITLTSNDPKKVHNLAAVILFSIAYGCSIAGVATPSGGARNAI
ncbi:MAG: SLC13 family permease, partial [Aestuariivirga sp.]